MSVHYPETLRRYLHYRKKNDFVVIKYGAEWCGPCKQLAPALERLAKEHPHVYFVDADVDKEEIAEHDDFKDVKKIPHVKFFVDGELKREIVGKDEEKLHRYVKRYSELKLNEKNQNNGKEEDIDKTVPARRRGVGSDRSESERSNRPERARPDRERSERRRPERNQETRSNRPDRERSSRSRPERRSPDRNQERRSNRPDRERSSRSRPERRRPERNQERRSNRPGKERSDRERSERNQERRRSDRSSPERNLERNQEQDPENPEVFEEEFLEEEVFEVPIEFDGENYEEYLKQYEAYLKALEEKEDLEIQVIIDNQEDSLEDPNDELDSGELVDNVAHDEESEEIQQEPPKPLSVQ